MICAFTGHRPERLPWRTDETDPRCRALKLLLQKSVALAYDRGFHTFLCGMARGCDQYFAETVLALQRAGRTPQAELVALVPCPTQPDGWPTAERARYAALLRACTRVEVLEPVYSSGCMLRRNRQMVQRAQLLISVFDGGAGGTAATVRYAKALGVEVLPVWL